MATVCSIFVVRDYKNRNENTRVTSNVISNIASILDDRHIVITSNKIVSISHSSGGRCTFKSLHFAASVVTNEIKRFNEFTRVAESDSMIEQ